jgi:acyl dehydratase
MIMNAAAAIEVGATLPALELPAISRTTLALFAGGSGDHNPIHIDTDFARAAGMPDVFAHGMLSMAYLGRLLTGWVEQRKIRSITVRFAAITPVGARPRCQGTVTAIDTTTPTPTATIELTVKLPDGTTTLHGTAVIDL